MCYAIRKTYERLYGGSPFTQNKTEDLSRLNSGGSTAAYPGKSLSTGIEIATAGSLKRKHLAGSSNINVSEY